jgi:peptidyl-prolyl cis-trans isomerase SurA
MRASVANPCLAVCLAAALAFALGMRGAPLADWSLAAQTATQPKRHTNDKQAAVVVKGEQAIVVLVNDEPVTAYQIDQRANFLGLNSGAGPELKARAEARWAEIIKDPKTNERFQAFLREKNAKTREEAQALQKQFIMDLQHSMLEQLKREARAGSLPRLRKDARDELIDERLKLQEAKKQGIEIADDDVKRMLTTLAEHNKMTYDQFAQHLKGVGVDITTIGERFRAQRAWRDLVMRRFGPQVTVTLRDVDRALSSTALDAGEDTVELQISKITLGLPGRDQVALAKWYTEAEALRRKFGGCQTMSELAKGVAGSRFEDVKFLRPSAVPEPTRSMLLSAKDGDMLPPTTTAAGIELYAVCGRRGVAVNDAQRNKTQEDLQYKQLDALAQRHMRNLRQDAHIEYR